MPLIKAVRKQSNQQAPPFLVTDMSPKRPFKAVIAGGGIAGLTLANMLEKFGLDYVLLEAHDEIAPTAGAAIGLMPNGSFILDQLGLYDPIRAIAGDADLEESYIRDPDGRPVGGLKHMMYHQQKR
jgi:2-polyprenyl-6-methoxyphenol hydroxylase-like FAD-dependent oxidoreductase